ncbi:Drug/Metabolite Transporter (DMT) Superfamily [Achlya hypogyna]|uniref:Drug/Metabolite Transporter (DMT) Superfamily n=1 Tax=Achlya hypogyna TaxID=1202772 RepID=A0A1V9Z040_ACHHY|nr:Drug/Metabolite Transporter (DMT) Superfamily [Achlya hypogyna]
MAFLGLETLAQKSIFCVYIGLWVSYGLLNEYAKRSHIKFHSATAVVAQCVVKLVLAVGLFTSQDGSLGKMLELFKLHPKLFMLYLIPSGLYALYDILAYVNLALFDPPTYFLLLQFRLVITGLLHQRVFSKNLNRNQWFAILAVTCGCVIKTIGDNAGAVEKPIPFFAYGLLMVQILSSTFAGVYNEALLKNYDKNLSIHFQNTVMYLDSIVFVMVCLALGITGVSFSTAVAPANLRVLLQWPVLMMVLIMSFIGVVTSLFLKYLDSVRKAIASGLELVVLPILASVLFQTALTGYLVLSVVLVAGGIYLYSLPVAPTNPPLALQKDSEDVEDEKSASAV